MIFVKGLKKSQKISRLIQISIAVILLFALVHLWKSSLNNGQQLLSSQTQIMARLLAQQVANGAAPAMHLQNDEQLQWLANALVLDPKVMSVNMYSTQGVRLAFAQSVSDIEFDADDKVLTEMLSPYPPLIENVLQGDNNLGYIEVRLNLHIFFDELKSHYQENMKQQQIMLIIAGIIGLLLSRVFSFKRADFDRRKTRAKQGRKNSQLVQKSLSEEMHQLEDSRTEQADVDEQSAKPKKSVIKESDSDENMTFKQEIIEAESLRLDDKSKPS
ncbi:AhpA/YtjB family protein [Shewanella sp. 5_MG-2023]|uniref:AhpA/YtjB family protein n=1 Tax=Shewanella sp. 5_MG-2023 TaxID=3062656 RepID=UPI0026E1D35A|nr:AhpA/YtjB family protein [Shewanella sp. 5_MG-2023]MDO6640071.1 AhpA/YtjB family protein [Shewanella sp. 5_MG-2023]